MNGAVRFGLPAPTLSKLNDVFSQHAVIAQVLIYGSRAKGNFRPGSDIDLTIKGEEISFAEFMQILSQLDDLMLPYTIDLSQYRQIDNPDLQKHIDRVGMVVYSKGT